MIIKAINFQTKDFKSFLIGYITQVVVDSLVQRLIVQSLLPIILMRMNEKKRKNLKAALTAEEVDL